MPKREPPRIILNAVEGWGKTSCGAFAPGAAILMAAGETGYSTLLGHDRVPAIPAATIETWPELLATIDAMIVDATGIQVLVFDAMGGFEAMCHQHVCNRDFGGDWGEAGFLSYHKGYDLAVKDWLQLLARLDRLRAAHGVGILLLSHACVRPFKNPTGEDFDRYSTDCHPKTWAPTHKWADCVLFGNFLTVVDKKKKSDRARGIGGTQRVVYTERRDTHDAKNRYGMSESFMLSNDPVETFDIIDNEIHGAKNANASA